MGSFIINIKYKREIHGTHDCYFNKLYFVLLMKSHLQSYPCPLQINFFWNLGFLLAVAIVLQIITGIFLALHYTSDVHAAYFSVFFLIREVYYGWSLRYFHSSGASFVFLFLFVHLGRGIFYGSYFYNPNTWFSGILLLCGFIILHLFYLHFHSSNNPLRLNTNNETPFFPFILLKDLIGLLLVFCLYFLQTHFGISSLSHPDNALEACPLLTPLHIVPEWYFLCQYAMLKAVPNKNAGFIILLTSILILFFFGEIRNLTTFTRLMDCNNGFSISFFFLSFLSFLWIGAQFP